MFLLIVQVAFQIRWSAHSLSSHQMRLLVYFSSLLWAVELRLPVDWIFSGRWWASINSPALSLGRRYRPQLLSSMVERALSSPWVFGYVFSRDFTASFDFAVWLLLCKGVHDAEHVALMDGKHFCHLTPFCLGPFVLVASLQLSSLDFLRRAVRCIVLVAVRVCRVVVL